VLLDVPPPTLDSISSRILASYLVASSFSKGDCLWKCASMDCVPGSDHSAVLCGRTSASLPRLVIALVAPPTRHLPLGTVPASLPAYPPAKTLREATQWTPLLGKRHSPTWPMNPLVVLQTWSKFHLAPSPRTRNPSFIQGGVSSCSVAGKTDASSIRKSSKCSPSTTVSIRTTPFRSSLQQLAMESH
jgi:hypothetical protein